MDEPPAHAWLRPEAIALLVEAESPGMEVIGIRLLPRID